MASVQELILAAQAKQKIGAGTQLAKLLDAASSGYTEGIAQKNVNAEADLRRSMIAKTLIEAQVAEEQRKNAEAIRPLIQEQLGLNSEEDLRKRQAGVAPPGTPTTPTEKLQREISMDSEGKVTVKFKPKEIKQPTSLEEGLMAEVNAGRMTLKQAMDLKNQPLIDRASQVQLMKDQAKLDREKPKAQGALDNTLREYDNMIAEANAIKNDPSLPSATGVFSPISHIPGTGAKRVSARLETLKAKTLLNVLSSLKQLSTTGASGFGALSNVEGEQIRNSISTLDAAQGTKDFQDSIDRFVKEMKARKENLGSTFNDIYGGNSSNSGSETPAERKARLIKELQGAK